MTKGVVVELPELLSLRHLAKETLLKTKPSFKKGERVSSLHGRGMEFSEVRNYQPGDEVRHMDWRVMARTGKPHVKIYQEERERPVMICVDFNASMYFGTRNAFKSVVAARLAALLAWQWRAEGDKVGGFLFASHGQQIFLPKARETGILAFFSGLSAYTKAYAAKAQKPVSISEALTHIRHRVKPGYLVIFISDFYHLDENGETHFLRMRERNDLLLYHVRDPLECNPPPKASYALSDGQDTLLLNTNSAFVQKEYKIWCVTEAEKVQSLAKKIHSPYFLVNTEENLQAVLLPSLIGRRHV